MSEGMPRPKSTIDTLRDRGRDIDAQVDAMVKPQPAALEPEVKKVEPKGMPKPGMVDRLKRLVGLK